MAKWLLLQKKADFTEIAKSCGISPVLSRLIRNRDVIGAEETAKYLNATTNDLIDPLLFHDIEKAAELLRGKIAEGKKIRIFGDYDVDGICSSYILLSLLKHLGADVSVVLPDRIADGYGINVRMVEAAYDEGIDTILTCDNGIAAAEPLGLAKEKGMTVIVTDHHEIPFALEGLEIKYQLPPADAIVEPKLVNPETHKPYFPFTEICGAVVAFHLAQLMLGMPDITGEPQLWQSMEQGLLRELLGFAALATVCDVMPLQNENRIIVRYGLIEIARTRNIGLKSLLTVNDLADTPLSGYHLGFVLGPCLNASGRLDTAEKALHLFCERYEDKAVQLAGELRALNDSRKAMTDKGVKDAMKQIESGQLKGPAATEEESGKTEEKTEVDRVLVVYVPDCHESIAGIIAGRIRERYQRPTFVLTDAMGEDGVLKGSGRSIEDYDMYAEMNRCKEHFLKFGGHKMAAGFSIAKEELDPLREALNANCTLTKEQMQDTMHIDMELPPHLVSLGMAKELDLLEPCGVGNTRPIFVTRNLTLHLDNVVGKMRNVCKFKGVDEKGHSVQLVWFIQAGEIPELTNGTPHRCHVVYYPDINTWRGRQSLQFIIKDVRILK